MKPSFRHRLEFALFKGAAKVLASLPWGTLQALGEGLGTLAWHVDRRHRRVARENLREADLGLGEAEILALGKGCFQHFGVVLLGTIHLLEASADTWNERVVVEGLEHFDAAQAEGRGFIQLTGHYGHWEAVALAQSLHGRSLSVIGRALDNPLLDPALRAFRERFGNRQIDKDGAMKACLQALREGRGLGFLLDQDALGAGLFVRFLGRWASTYGSAATLAVRFDLPVLPVFSWPREDGRIQVQFEPPFHVPRTGDQARDVWTATQLMVARIEGAIRRDPRWWFWMHNRFKTQPGHGHLVSDPEPPPEWLSPCGGFHAARTPPTPPAPSPG